MIKRVEDVGDVGDVGRVVGEARSDGDVSSDARLSGDREETARIIRTARRVLEIVPGERRLLPGFGCRVHALESLDGPHSRSLAAGLVEEALERWAPALGVERAEVHPAEGGWVRVALRVSARWHEFGMKRRREVPAPTSTSSVSPGRPEEWPALEEDLAR